MITNLITSISTSMPRTIHMTRINTYNRIRHLLHSRDHIRRNRTPHIPITICIRQPLMLTTNFNIMCHNIQSKTPYSITIRIRNPTPLTPQIMTIMRNRRIIIPQTTRTKITNQCIRQITKVNNLRRINRQKLQRTSTMTRPRLTNITCFPSHIRPQHPITHPTYCHHICRILPMIRIHKLQLRTHTHIRLGLLPIIGFPIMPRRRHHIIIRLFMNNMLQIYLILRRLGYIRSNSITRMRILNNMNSSRLIRTYHRIFMHRRHTILILRSTLRLMTRLRSCPTPRQLTVTRTNLMTMYFTQQPHILMNNLITSISMMPCLHPTMAT